MSEDTSRIVLFIALGLGVWWFIKSTGAGGVLSGLGDGLRLGFGALGTLLRAPRRLWEFGARNWDRLKRRLGRAASWAGRQASHAADFAKRQGSAAVDVAQGAASSVKNTVVDISDPFVDTARDAGHAVMGGVRSAKRGARRLIRALT